MKKLFRYSVLALLAVTGLLLWNTWRLPAPPAVAGEAMPLPADLAAAAQRLAEAVRIPTISRGFATTPDDAQFAALHRLLEQRFPRVHQSLRREPIGSASLLYTWAGSDATLAPILLIAHQDVVPIEPGSEARWTHPPFSGAIADGFVWGRGTLDNKHMLLASLEAVEHLLAQGAQPRRTVLLAFGHDEEIGGQLGARLLAAKLAERGVKALFSVDEGSAILAGVVPGVRRPVAQIGLAEKGYLSVQLTAHGRGGHSSMPPPHTAVGRLAKAVAALEAQPMPASLAGPGGAGLRALASAMPWGVRMLIANEGLFAPLLLHELAKNPATNALIRTTTAATMISGGVKDNVLPTSATAVVNFRIAPGQGVAQVLAHVRQVIADPEVDVVELPGQSHEATPVADVDGPGYALISAAIARVAPEALIAPGLVVTGTDSKHYREVSRAAYRFTPMRLAPDDIRRIHASDERIAIRNYGEIINFYIALLQAGALNPAGEE